ncbi:isopentenyl-diphosphate delta-isomerase, type 1 [Pseudopedobacter saltans DSM 12145]|uniref:Isopentenyl-diphosphate delta-isomerase n=1 Tax=Pseudopedobacter saltans (strain ATCC 51119 / DSM 12145 / JCM 21818 / CCUG 39354 / LMG 10337 / NBRC 100064 / NCIMB 13643) TaxID=762903 RepID=F0S7L9_PSESL|nr:isopentenyl-diphosphate Delta-isomerase [Pseudopedobacter saltans]ADY52279.1 isopentenyl-diphosphate delta-isomerase, type 1 [Pseudopedobacter saltans DSM 12145]
MEEQVILVNENDEAIGTMAKLGAHLKPTLHRAFSVCLFNDKGEMLLQKRASGKYHCGGLWTNTCCSHPRPEEDTLNAANRRLMEEMGITTELSEVFDFTYQAVFDNGLFEYEFDHVFFGTFSDKPLINTEEVEDWKYLSLEDIRIDLSRNPEKYTPWFKLIIEKLDN